MTKEQLHHILDRLDFWMAQSKKWQEAVNQLCKTISPSSFSPIVEDSFVQSFIDGVSQNNKELKEDLEYYAYELSTMDSAQGECKGQKYNLKNREEFVEFIVCSIPHGF